ncbi:unnamed protein product [Sympodiomycopsis kandeliae]
MNASPSPSSWGQASTRPIVLIDDIDDEDEENDSGSDHRTLHQHPLHGNAHLDHRSDALSISSGSTPSPTPSPMTGLLSNFYFDVQSSGGWPSSNHLAQTSTHGGRAPHSHRQSMIGTIEEESENVSALQSPDVSTDADENNLQDKELAAAENHHRQEEESSAHDTNSSYHRRMSSCESGVKVPGRRDDSSHDAEAASSWTSLNAASDPRIMAPFLAISRAQGEHDTSSSETAAKVHVPHISGTDNELEVEEQDTSLTSSPEYTRNTLSVSVNLPSPTSPVTSSGGRSPASNSSLKAVSGSLRRLSRSFSKFSARSSHSSKSRNASSAKSPLPVSPQLIGDRVASAIEHGSTSSRSILSPTLPERSSSLKSLHQSSLESARRSQIRTKRPSIQALQSMPSAEPVEKQQAYAGSESKKRLSIHSSMPASPPSQRDKALHSRKRASILSRVGDAFSIFSHSSTDSTVGQKASPQPDRRLSWHPRGHRHQGVGPENYSGGIEGYQDGGIRFNNGRFLPQEWMHQQTLYSTAEDIHSEVVDFPAADHDDGDLLEDGASAPAFDQAPSPTSTLLVRGSLRRMPNFNRALNIADDISGCEVPPLPLVLNHRPAARKRSVSMGDHTFNSVAMAVSHSLPNRFDEVVARDHVSAWQAPPAKEVGTSYQPAPKRPRPTSMFSSLKASRRSTWNSIENSVSNVPPAPSRPTSVVVGPFELQLPEDVALAGAKERSGIRRFSLPPSLDHKAANATYSNTLAREKAFARRSLRRRDVDLGLGMSIPLQLGFAAGLAWNSEVDERPVSKRESDQENGRYARFLREWQEPDPDESVTVHGSQHGRPSPEARRLSARQKSMDILEGKGKSVTQLARLDPKANSPEAAQFGDSAKDTPLSPTLSAGSSSGSSVVPLGRRTLVKRRSALGGDRLFYTSPVMANLHSMSQAMLAADIPSYISARSANSIISESRPTRIQAQTLAYLNRILDELLLFIVVSARSLATDRIKSDGLLKVLNNNVLAKDAVLEAELELRNYLQSKKAEGGRVPLGLSATSRWDGTEAFPVASAYTALRNRCQYYSTLGDREDDSVTGDQHIMSAEGRPIATITPGVSIYVTALLEFVGEYILQNVARVIERDNSDEASLADLRSAIEEDEALITMWRQMVVKQEVEKEMKAATLGSDRRVTRPWKVPEGSDYDEAATPARFRTSTQAQRPGTAQGQNPPPGWGSNDRGSSSVSGHGDYSYSESHSGNSIAGSSSATPGVNSYSTSATTPTGDSSVTGHGSSTIGANPLTRRGSVDKGLSSLFSGRRRGSFRNSEDQAASAARAAALQQQQQTGSQSAAGQHGRSDSKTWDSSAEPVDDFEALMMSGQTMKVSLTPNRLRTIEVARQEAEAKKARQRPGTLNVSNLRSDAAEGASPSTGVRNSGAASPAGTVTTTGESGQPSSRNSVAPSPSSMGPKRITQRVSNPPSSYRGPEAQQSATNGGGGSSFSAADASLVQEGQRGSKMTPRDKRASWSASKDLMDLFNTTPPSPSSGPQFAGVSPSGLRHSSTASQSSVDNASIGRKGGVGGKMRALLGRRSNSGKDSPVPGARADSRQSQSSSIRAADQQSIWSDQQHDVRGQHGSIGHTREGSSNDDPASISGHDALIEEESSPPAAHRPMTPTRRTADQSVGGNDEMADTSHERTPGPPRGMDVDDDDDHVDGEPSSSVAQTPIVGQTPRSSTGGGGAVVGIYDERKSPAGSGSALEEFRPEGPPSRKIPYGRRASREGVVTMQRTRSERSDGGTGTGSPALYERANGTASALGYVRSPAIASAGSRSVSANEGFSTALSGPPDTRAGEQLRHPDAAHQDQAAISLATLRLLTNLDRQMKLATSVQECRAIVTEALDDALRGHTASPEDLSMSEVKIPSIRQLSSTTDANTEHVLLASKDGMVRPMPVLRMADSYDEDVDETSTAYQEHSQVAAWLLDEGFAESALQTPSKTGPTSISPSNSTGSHLDAPNASGEFSRTRKLSSSTTLDENAYASADEGDVEDEYESSATEAILPANASVPMPPVKTKMSSPSASAHPPSASGAALRAAKTATGTVPSVRSR